MIRLSRCPPNQEPYQTDRTRPGHSAVHNQARLVVNVSVAARSLPFLTCGPLNPPYIVHTLQAWAQPSMNTKDLARHDRSDGQSIKDIDERLPSLDIRSSFTFVIESIHCSGQPSNGYIVR